MANVTPNMGLVLPVSGAGGTAGPTYANDLTNQTGGGGSSLTGAFWVIDSHNHTSGQGVPIPSSGLNINADLSFNANRLTNTSGVTFQTLTGTPAGNAQLYFVNRELFVTDNSGSTIQITNSGSIAGASGSISGLVSPASAAFNNLSGTFIWQQAASKAASMDCGNVIFRDPTNISVQGITVGSPVGIGSAFSMTWPAALPGSTLPIQLSATGAMTAAQLTRPQLPTVGQQVSSSVSFSINSSSYQSVTNGSISITTSGRPINILLQPDGTSGSASGISFGAASQQVTLGLSDNGGSSYFFETAVENDSFGSTMRLPPSTVHCLRVVSSGTYTIQLYGKASTGTCNIVKCVLVAWET